VPSAGDPQTLNRYSYVRNNPLIYVDPSGNDFGLTAFLITVAISVASNVAITAAQGGNIGQGIATGAIGGLFGGLGAWAGQGFLATAFGKFWGGFVGAVAGGAVSAAAFGGNVGLGAATGAVGAAIGYGFGQLAIPDPGHWMDDLWNYAVSSAGGALGGGIGAVIQGGDFWQGARFGAIGGAVGYGAVQGINSVLYFFAGPTRVQVETDKGSVITKTFWSVTEFKAFLEKLAASGEKVVKLKTVGHANREQLNFGVEILTNTASGDLFYYNRITGETGDITTALQQSLAKDAVIELRGCSSYGQRGTDTIAYAFKQSFPSARVYGYTGFAIRWPPGFGMRTVGLMGRLEEVQLR
jgi:hypothetical protein